ncbi:hypothetical protein COV19_00025 [Candidatus Woesearchaeota archaeon CG10_big_fil_rev_8_21_14_0_10_44_13]|nr:MAG: hypothetical protein COV19_00025 [Candidatus Woesearchaeota archaeon CG10_big_fil_rev_8_21_14_0_10_44_13]
MAKISLWRIIVSALVFLAVMFIVNNVGAILTMGYYTDPGYSSVWSKLMMPSAGPPPASFFYYSLSFGLIGSLLFIGTYVLLGSRLPFKSSAKKGAMYGFLVFLAGVLPGYMSLYLLINLPAGLIAWWAVLSLVIYMTGGIIAASINK